MTGAMIQRLGSGPRIIATISPPTGSAWLPGSPFQSATQLMTSATGGTPPYAYLWEVTGDAMAASPTSANTFFSSVSGDAQQARCRVTDTDSNLSFTPFVPLG